MGDDNERRSASMVGQGDAASERTDAAVAAAAAAAAVDALVVLARALRADNKEYGAGEIERLIHVVESWGRAV